MSASRKQIVKEFARRANTFHKGKDPMTLSLWGLFQWGDISHLIKSGDIIPNAGYTKENRTIWCKPSREFYDTYIREHIDWEKDNEH